MQLIDNGLHSFKKAIENLKILDEKSDTEREFVAKEIVLSLHHSIETLFKYMVQEKNELLIYDKLDDYFSSKMNLIKGKGKSNFNGSTITFMEAIQRAVVLNALEMNETDYGSFEKLNSVRNAITHHEYDLTGKEINYLITQVVTVVIPIFKKLIPNFSVFARSHDLNLIGSIQVKELHVWKFIRFFTLFNKFKEANNKFETIIQTPGEFDKKKEKIKKKSFITYHKCPCCQKPFFVKDNVVVDDMEEKGYTGTCMICEISLDKDDSYFIYLNSDDYHSFYKDYQKRGYVIVKDLLDDGELKNRITDQDLITIRQILNVPNCRTLLIRLTNNYLHYKLDNILEQYVDKIVYKYDSAFLDNALYTGKITDSRDIEELSDDDLNLLKKIFENFGALELTEPFYKDALSFEYSFYLNITHPNPHQDNEDEEIDVQLYLTLTDLSFFDE